MVSVVHLLSTCYAAAWISLYSKGSWDTLTCRYCVVTLLKMMRIISWHICAEVLSTIISRFQLGVELECDLQFYLLSLAVWHSQECKFFPSEWESSPSEQLTLT